MLEVRINGGFEIVAVVEDLITLCSTACVFIYVETDKGKRLYEALALMDIPED